MTAEHDLGGDEIAAADVILTELLSNVARHARSPACVSVECHDDRLVLTVSDEGPGFTPEPAVAPGPRAEQGRGLWIVSQLADDLHIAPRGPRGAEVSALLRLSRDPPR